MEISLKEARETEYWLIVLVKSGCIALEKVKSLQE
jgi:four helix bundle protein